MKKIILGFLILALGLNLFSPSLAIKKTKGHKKTKLTAKAKRIIRLKRVKYRGPRPVFPIYKGDKERSVPPPPRIILPEVERLVSPKPISSLFGEAGFGGGALLCSLGYRRSMSENLNLDAAVGLGLGSGYSVVVLDLARATYDLKDFYVGGGLSYAAYSTVVTLAGSSSSLTSLGLVGLEVFAGKQIANLAGFKNVMTKIGYNTALGIRLSAGYEF